MIFKTSLGNRQYHQSPIYYVNIGSLIITANVIVGALGSDRKHLTLRVGGPSELRGTLLPYMTH